MDERRIASVVKGLREQATTEELLQALNENNHASWSEEGFEAIKRVLKERSVNYKEFPELNEIAEGSSFDIKFRTNIKKIKGDCPYLGNGTIVLSQYGLKIFGKTSYSLGAKIFIGTLIVFFSIALSILLKLPKLYMPSIWLIYFIVEAVVRKRHNILIPWKNITSVEHDERHKFVGIEYTGFPDYHPLVFKSDSCDVIISELDKKIFDTKTPL
jgi:hypothetical protein